MEKRKELKVWTKYANHAFLGLLQNQFYSMESCVPGSSVKVRPANCVSSGSTHIQNWSNGTLRIVLGILSTKYHSKSYTYLKKSKK